jgi:uncharacterized membrane protein required for colicin V production
MSIYDIVMLIIFIGSIWFGFRKGLAWQVASLMSIVLSYFVAVNFRNPVAALISAQAPWNQFAAMLILFLGTSLVVWTVFASFSRNIKKMNMGGFDRQAGAIVGGFKGAILAMLATVFAVSLFQPTRDMVHNSKAGYYVVSGIRQFARFTPDELLPYLEPHYQKFDQTIGATPEKRALFESNTTAPNFQANQNNGFQNNGFQTNAPNYSSGGGFSNVNASSAQQTAPNYYLGQFQTPQQQQPTNNSNGFGLNRQATTQNYNSNNSYPQNNGQFYQPQQTQPQQYQNGYTQPQQPQRSITTGQNGWPEINTTINTKDVIQRGVETTAEMLRRAYDSNMQPR